MTTSKTIAALLGPTLVATALMVLLNLEAMPALIAEISQTPMVIVLAGYAAFVPGLAIVYFHNRWTAAWPTLITLFGWLSVIIGFLRIVFPTQLAGVMSRAAHAPAMHIVLPAIGAVFLIIGGVLSYKAYVRE
jgi:hypothetical protein